MTTFVDSTLVSTLAAASRAAARTRPSFRGTGHGEWRPASWDIREVAGFALALSGDLGITVGRITLNPGSWSEHPRLLPLPDHCLRIDWFDAAAVDEVSVRRGYGPRLTIRLVPPSGPATRLVNSADA